MALEHGVADGAEKEELAKNVAAVTYGGVSGPLLAKLRFY